MSTVTEVQRRPRSVLVTGGSSGIGAAVAEAFLAEGDRVIVFDRRPSRSSAVAFVEGDVTNAADNLRAVEVAAPGGRLDVLIANAGVHDGGMGFASCGIDELEVRLRHVLDVNLVGYVLAIKAAADALERARGSVLLTLSDASFDVTGNGAGLGYAASKHAGLGLLRIAARDLAPAVRVNAVAPGGVPTDLSLPVHVEGGRRLISDPEALAGRLAERTLLGRGARISEIASAYVYLASEAAGGISGQALRVDGGLIN